MVAHSEGVRSTISFQRVATRARVGTLRMRKSGVDESTTSWKMVMMSSTGIRSMGCWELRFSHAALMSEHRLARSPFIVDASAVFQMSASAEDNGSVLFGYSVKIGISPDQMYLRRTSNVCLHVCEETCRRRIGHTLGGHPERHIADVTDFGLQVVHYAKALGKVGNKTSDYRQRRKITNSVGQHDRHAAGPSSG